MSRAIREHVMMSRFRVVILPSGALSVQVRPVGSVYVLLALTTFTAVSAAVDPYWMFAEAPHTILEKGAAVVSAAAFSLMLLAGAATAAYRSWMPTDGPGDETVARAVADAKGYYPGFLSRSSEQHRNVPPDADAPFRAAHAQQRVDRRAERRAARARADELARARAAKVNRAAQAVVDEHAGR